MRQVSPKIESHIKAEILPKYSGLGGHTDDHIQQVIKRSLQFAEQIPDINIDMVYIIASYHDLGRIIDNETHNIESAKMMRNDAFLKANFTTEEIRIMAEAVEDHRASLGHEPRSIYGKIVSSADRNTDINTMLSRVFDYTKHIHPEMTEDEIIEEARIHLREKYSPNGYASKTMYFDDQDFENVLIRVEEITRAPKTFAKVMRKHNEKRKC